MTPERSKAMRDLLEFYAEAGVDAAVGEQANDWLSPQAPVATAQPAAERAGSRPNDPGNRGLFRTADRIEAPAPRTAPLPPAPDAAVMAAREAARSAQSLDALRDILGGFDGCGLKASASRLVFADGTAPARLMFVGEAPGAEEDKQGLPFVGRSGQLLDRMLKAIGLDRSKVYIANIVPWRPPGNRTPTPQESAICLPFTLRQIELADPDVLVCLGGPSAQTLLEIRDGILKARGRWYPFHTGRREIRALATLHPAYLLRQPVQKRLAWRDFLAIKKALAAS
jgi:uracil-DNA glycosylase family 4